MSRILVKQENRYIVNVRSFGQLRDGNTDAALIVYDSEERTVKFHYFEFDLSFTQHKIRKTPCIRTGPSAFCKDDDVPFIYRRALLTLIR